MERTQTVQPTEAPNTALASKVRIALGLHRSWVPKPEFGETATRVSMWSQLELNAVFERVGGTVTSRKVQRTGSADTWTATEITVTVTLPGIGRVEAFTDWDEDHGGHGLPVMRAIAAEPVAELHRQAAADYAAAQGNQGAARNQLAEARIHGNEAAGA